MKVTILDKEGNKVIGVDIPERGSIEIEHHHNDKFGITPFLADDGQSERFTLLVSNGGGLTITPKSAIEIEIN